jgi:hypothetical protein
MSSKCTAPHKASDNLVTHGEIAGVEHSMDWHSPDPAWVCNQSGSYVRYSNSRFTLSLLRDKDFAPPLGARRLFELALAALLASIIVGVACVVNRLTDFRASRRIATRREKLEEKDMPRGEINEALSLPRRDNKDRGDRTWKWFRWQIGAFTVGVVALALSLLFTYSVKLGLGAS